MVYLQDLSTFSESLVGGNHLQLYDIFDHISLYTLAMWRALDLRRSSSLQSLLYPPNSDAYNFYPFLEIRKLHMPLGRKISAAAVFALVIIDIVTGLARNISTVLAALGIPTDTSGGTQELCDVIEPALAVLICSLPAYKALVFKFRSHRTDKLNFQRHAANIGGKRWLPHKLRLLTASIPSPFLDISILGPAPTTEQRSEESLIKAPEVSHVVAGEEEKQH
ncbi:hypothetical protein MMC10_009140 [Thelotrema lepadinum]|nr:hypothetical protein [Thelotrema lepadinum]